MIENYFYASIDKFNATKVSYRWFFSRFIHWYNYHYLANYLSQWCVLKCLTFHFSQCPQRSNRALYMGSSRAAAYHSKGNGIKISARSLRDEIKTSVRNPRKAVEIRSLNDKNSPRFHHIYSPTAVEFYWIGEFQQLCKIAQREISCVHVICSSVMSFIRKRLIH